MLLKKENSIRWIFVLKWIGMTAVGSLAGILLGIVTHPFIGEIFAFTFFGLLLGVSQWILLRKFFEKAVFWIVINTVGFPLALFIHNAFESYFIRGFEYIASKLIPIVIFGLIIGIIQWLVINRTLQQSAWWIIANFIAWPLPMALLLFYGPILGETIMFLLYYLISGIVSGGITGLILFLLLKEGSHAKNKKSGVLQYVGGIILILLICLSTIQIIFIHNNQSIGDAPPLPGENGCTGLPEISCTGDPAYCTELVPFEPDHGTGYIDSPENGETWDNQYRSYLQRDLMMLVIYATARVDCSFQGWDRGLGGPLGLADMSEVDGSIPGTSDGVPDHPSGTHENGLDIDVAYYHKPHTTWLTLEDFGLENEGNMLGIVCDDTRFGINVFHCGNKPYLLDPWRTAMFLAYLSEHPRIRVIGVDGRVGPVLDETLDKLVSSGWLSAEERDQIPVIYETIQEGMGWFFHHQHHIHVSLNDLPVE